MNRQKRAKVDSGCYNGAVESDLDASGQVVTSSQISIEVVTWHMGPSSLKVGTCNEIALDSRLTEVRQVSMLLDLVCPSPKWLRLWHVVQSWRHGSPWPDGLQRDGRRVQVK